MDSSFLADGDMTVHVWRGGNVSSSEGTSRCKKLPLWTRLKQRWNEIQVDNQGKYSVERLESFNCYMKTTSLTRAILVCVLTPLPVLVATLLLECLPLSPPSDGWRANWVFLVRFGLVAFPTNFAYISQLSFFVPDLQFTPKKRLIVSVCATTGIMGFYLTTAEFVGFPAPFAWQLGAILISCITPAIILVVLGRSPFTEESPFRPHLQRFFKVFMAHSTLFAFFPLCKLYIVRAVRGQEDYMSESVALIVDLFSALFVSVCTYTSGSIGTSVLVIVSDVGQSLLEFRDVRANADAVLELLQERRSLLASRSKETDQIGKHETIDLVEFLVAVTRNPSAFKITSLRRVRLWASLPHSLPNKLFEQLKVLEASGVYGYTRARVASSRLLLRDAISVAPAPNDFKTSSSTTLNVVQLPAVETNTKPDELIVQGLQILFHCEYLTLVEYIECVVPLIFVTYKSVLEVLPNVVYYPGGAGVWGLPSVANILLFSLMEIGSFLLLHAFLQRKFAFSPLYQLAFVLETQLLPVQAKLFLEIVILLPYELFHLGADFSLRFEWLRSSNV